MSNVITDKFFKKNKPKETFIIQQVAVAGCSLVTVKEWTMMEVKFLQSGKFIPRVSYLSLVCKVILRCGLR